VHSQWPSTRHRKTWTLKDYAATLLSLLVKSVGRSRCSGLQSTSMHCCKHSHIYYLQSSFLHVNQIDLCLNRTVMIFFSILTLFRYFCFVTGPLQVERKFLPQHFTLCIVDVHLYKNISLPRYRVPRKTIKFVPVVPKGHGRDNVCAHWKCIKPWNFQKYFGGFFYKGWYVVVYPCSNFSLRCQMAPLRNIKFQTADFPIFWASFIVISEQRV